MSDLSDLLVSGAVLADVGAGNKRSLFAALAKAAQTAWGIEAAALAEALAARERLGTTGFGGGVAVPHARAAGLEQVRGVFVRLSRPIEFAAVDDQPIDLAFMLVSPEDAGAEHLKALARVSRRLRDRAFAGKLRGAASRDALYALLSGVDVRDAA